MKSVISFAQTRPGCSLVLHKLLDQDTVPRELARGDQTRWRGLGVPSSRGQQSSAGRSSAAAPANSEPLCAPSGKAQGTRRAACSFSVEAFSLSLCSEDTAFGPLIDAQVLCLFFSSRGLLCWVRFCLVG